MRRLAGITTAEFWRLTPAECDDIAREAIDDRLAWDKRNDWRTASLMCLIANIHSDREYTIQHFLPGGDVDPTDEELENKLHAILGV